MPSFLKRNSREKREPEIFACAHALHSLGFEKLGAVGFCFGGWACFRLAAESSVLLNGAPLIDVISVGNPSLLTKEDVDGLKDGSVVKVQILAPEKDPVFTEELKRYTFERFLEKRIAFDWRAFPGVVHGSLVRGGEDHVGERDAMVKAKDAVVRWMREGLEY
jgi:dienelactone hydrolase